MNKWIKQKYQILGIMKLVQIVKSLSLRWKNWVIWKLVFSKMLGAQVVGWLSPSRSLVSRFTSIGFWQAKILFAVGLMKFKIFDLICVCWKESKPKSLGTNRQRIADGQVSLSYQYVSSIFFMRFIRYLET